MLRWYEEFNGWYWEYCPDMKPINPAFSYTATFSGKVKIRGGPFRTLEEALEDSQEKCPELQEEGK
jgi:hypothetical protein